MKFTYDDKPAQPRPVAYIDSEGDLVIQGEQDGTAVCIFQDGVGQGEWDFDPDDPANRSVFYPGDSITITF